MDSSPDDTETVVHNHLRAFLNQEDVTVMMRDYHDQASFISEQGIYRGKEEIRSHLDQLIAALPPTTIALFELKSLRVVDDVAHIVWSAGEDLPLGTDTFVVREGKIVSQTFTLFSTPPS